MLKKSPSLISLSSVCSEWGVRRLEESLRIREKHCYLKLVLCRQFPEGTGNSAVNRDYSNSDAAIQ